MKMANTTIKYSSLPKRKGISDEFLALCKQISAKGGYKFCPGFNPDMYKTTYLDFIRYDPKSLRRTVYPVQRIDSSSCILWHKLAKNASIFEKNMTEVMCPACKCLRNELTQRLKKVNGASLQQKENRVKPTSHFPEKYLSPKSLKRKRQNMQQERSKLLKKYSHLEVSLSEDQHDQMCNIMEKVTQIGADELESSLALGDKQGVGPAVRALWKNDLQNIKKEFDQDQQRNSKYMYILVTAHKGCVYTYLMYLHYGQYTDTRVHMHTYPLFFTHLSLISNR